MKNIASAAAIAIASAISFFASPANAQIPAPSNNWVQTGQSFQGNTVFLDVGTLSRQGNQAGYWMQINKVNGTASRSYIVANCNNRTKSIRWVVTFDNGNVTNNTPIDNPQNANVVVASLGDSAYQVACPNQLNQATDRQISEAEMLYRLMIDTARLAR